VKTLIIKLNATGDVVRTTSLLRVLQGDIVLLTDKRNLPLLQFERPGFTPIAWGQHLDADLARHSFDRVISLEDDVECCAFASSIATREMFGAFIKNGIPVYTDSAKGWFDLSLISRFGREHADYLKLVNRRSYQELIFEGLGLEFVDERYVLPAFPPSELTGDVALSPTAGPVWPMKNWAYYNDLKTELQASGWKVNILPKRSSLLEHLSDIANHRCLVSGDSLPMHLALGVGVPCISLFTCTSPWEIHGYGLQTKIVSPLLDNFFYKRTFDPIATTAIPLDRVYNETVRVLTSRNGFGDTHIL
jgi:heptosyltransferase II